DAVKILRQQRLERLSLFILVGLPGGLFQIADRRLTGSRFARLRRLRLTKAKRSYSKQRDKTKNGWFFHTHFFIQMPNIRRVLLHTSANWFLLLSLSRFTRGRQRRWHQHRQKFRRHEARPYIVIRTELT